MKNINRIAFFNILSILLLQGISFISAPLFSRLLGTDGFGDLASFNIWSTLSCTILSVMTNATIPNARVEYPEEQQAAYQSSVMFLSILVYLAGAAVTMAAIGPISGLLKMSGGLIALIFLSSFGSFGVNFLSSKYTYEFQADKNMFLSVGMVVATLAASLAFVLTMPYEQRFLGRVLGNTLVYAAVGICACGWVLKKGKTFYHREYWKFCLMLAVPMVFQNISYQLLGNSDIMMLRQMAGSSDSGIYSLSYTMAGVMFTIFGALNNTWVPFFFDDMKDNRRENAAAQAEHFLELFTVLSVGFLLLVREVFYLYGGEEFRQGTELLPLFVGSYYVNFLCTFPVNYEYYRKKTSAVAATTIGAALINLVLNYMFILKFGMVGAAVATLLSHLLQFAIHEVYSRLVLGRGDYPFALSSWVKYSAGFTAAMAVFYLLPNAWLIRWGIGAVVGVMELWRMWKRKSLL